MRAILISRDLFFISKIREVVTAQGHELVVVKSDSAFRDAIESSIQPGTILVDVDKTPLPLEVIARDGSAMKQLGWRYISFFSHTQHEVGRRAEELELGEVMPRSRFVRLLPDLFSSM